MTINPLKHPAFYMLLIILASILMLNVRYPLVGCDNFYYVPRLLDDYMYYLKNGLEIHWWTPSFGGGLPSYPNPQQMQFTIQELFLFVINPWLSINVTNVIFITIGYCSMFLLLHRELLLPKDHAILGATLFSVTGFYIEHLSNGHLGYITFPLLPLVIILLLNYRLPIPIAATGLALIMTYLIYSAGFYLLVIFLFSAPMTLLLLYTLSTGTKPDILRLFFTAFMGLVLGILLSSSKLVAIGSFMKYFPRHAAVSFEVSVLKALTGFIGQLFFTPIAIFFKRLLIGNILRYFTGAFYGLWELDIGLSPVILVILISFLIVRVKSLQELKIHVSRRKIILLALMALFIWVAFELSIAKGYTYKYLKNVALMKSLRTNVRFTSIFVLPLTILSIYSYNWLERRMKFHALGRFNLSLLLSFIAIVCYTAYLTLPEYERCMKFNIDQTLTDWEEIRRGYNDYKVLYVAPVTDTKVFKMQASSFRAYEPMLSSSQNLTPEIRTGMVNEIDGSFFNLTNPASLVFPEENGLAVFQRILISDADNFEKFITYRRPGWKLSTMQQIANTLSLCTIIVILVILFGYFTKYMLERKISIRH